MGSPLHRAAMPTTRSARFLSEENLDAQVVLSARAETPQFEDHKR